MRAALVRGANGNWPPIRVLPERTHAGRQWAGNNIHWAGLIASTLHLLHATARKPFRLVFNLLCWVLTLPSPPTDLPIWANIPWPGDAGLHVEFLPREGLKSSRMDIRDADADALEASSDSCVLLDRRRHAISASILSILFNLIRSKLIHILALQSLGKMSIILEKKLSLLYAA